MTPPVLTAFSSRGTSYEVPMIEADRPMPGCSAPNVPARSRIPLPPSQAAAVPYRVRGGQVEILLVTSRTRNRWIVPKGCIERGATPPETALEEAFEEAGVRGSLRLDPLGHYRHGRGRRAPVVEAYLLLVEGEADTWPERGERTRQWVPASVAASRVDVPGLRPILRRAAKAVFALAR